VKLYNTLTRKIDTFEPISNDEVKIYSCGPTVYDNIHIGNMRAFIAADTLKRSLKLAGYKVKHVMNITDIDDKIIRNAQTEFPDLSPEEARLNLTKPFEESFMEDITDVGNDVASINFIKATDKRSIEAMQKLIAVLHSKGFAYIADDGIYFSIEAYKKSGKKYGQLLELTTTNTSQARINNDEYDKESASDFALWKFMEEDEPAWSFYIDEIDYIGRPGWHIECSAMSYDELGLPFDIHTGGIDLIFPHHENEIAQSTATNSDPIYAKYFVHNEHLKIDGNKMSKSLANFFTSRDIREHNFDLIDFRMLILQGHYRKQSEFSWELLEAAANRLKSLRNFAALRWQALDGKSLEFDYKDTTKTLKECLEDDLNTPQFLAKLSDIQRKLDNSFVSTGSLEDFNKLIDTVDLALGLNLASVEDIDDPQKAIIKQRAKAREDKDWIKSDNLRDELLSSGVGIRDTSAGQIWYRS
jgi:cysteinyl-tRNA synthetase